jgi:PIN domain nuclease of toxin-antitoxin system
MTMAILIDTHILLWLRAAPDRLTENERRAIEKAPCRYISAVSSWEIATLIGLDRIENDHRLFDLPMGFDLLPVTPGHCKTLLELPSLHRDPFDRMLIAQARTDALLLLTRDSKIISYGRAGAATANLMS